MYLKLGFEIRRATKAITAFKERASEPSSHTCTAHEPSSTWLQCGHQDTCFSLVPQGHEPGWCDRVGMMQTQWGLWKRASVQKEERLCWTVALCLEPGFGINQSCQVEAMTQRDHCSCWSLSCPDLGLSLWPLSFPSPLQPCWCTPILPAGSPG